MVSALKVDVSDTDLMTLYAGGTADDHVVWTAGHHRVLEPRVLNTSVLHVRFISGLWNNEVRVPYTLVCDFRSDCSDASDEEFCVHRPCETGQFHCGDKQHDDELLCDLTCPENCTCYGLAFFCNSTFPAAHFPDLRFLDAGGSNMTPADLENNTMLIHLSLARCVDRFLVLRFPFRNLRFQKRSAHLACIVAWILGLLLAVCPLLPFTTHWEFYSQTGICIPLPITRQEFPGHVYSFGVMIVFNFILFVSIATGQVFIYLSIRANSMAAADTSKQSKDMTIARRLISVVVSDFLCWFPIGLLGMLTLTGTPIPGEVNVAMAIVVLPVNSVLNPFLYTLNILLERRRRAREEHVQAYLLAQWEKGNKEVAEEKMHVTYTEDEAWTMLIGWLSRGVLSHEQVEDQLGQTV
nr:hypothetical protein BaRGS_006657 [Batillaria attramentaria]